MAGVVLHGITGGYGAVGAMFMVIGLCALVGLPAGRARYVTE